jgi:hypothetical protein
MQLWGKPRQVVTSSSPLACWAKCVYNFSSEPIAVITVHVQGQNCYDQKSH